VNLILKFPSSNNYTVVIIITIIIIAAIIIILINYYEYCLATLKNILIFRRVEKSQNFSMSQNNIRLIINKDDDDSCDGENNNYDAVV